MNWLERLKKNEDAPRYDPTKTTKRVSVVSVGSILGTHQKFRGLDATANTPGCATANVANPAKDAPQAIPTLATLATLAVADVPKGWRVAVAPGTPPDALARLRAASLALDKAQASIPYGAEAWLERAAIAEFDGGLSRTDAEALADAACWPHSTAMNGAEIDTYTERMARFTDRGLSLPDAEALADRLVNRDREQDDRRVCPECRYLKQGRCGNWRMAGVGEPLLPKDLLTLLQRCEGFA